VEPNGLCIGSVRCMGERAGTTMFGDREERAGRSWMTVFGDREERVGRLWTAALPVE
jgi:hypothetical protein